MNSTRNNKKSSFINRANNKPYQMSGVDISKLIRYYAARYNIRIIKNGTTDHYKNIINERNIESAIYFNDEYEALKLFESTDTSLVSYFSYCATAYSDALCCVGFDLDECNIFQKSHALNAYIEQLEEIFSCSREDIPNTIRNMTHEQIERLNNELKQNAKKLGILKDLAHHAENLKSLLQKMVSNQGLESDECIDEIHKIQQSLQENEYVGYVFTNGHQNDSRHFEILIISRDKIIKPIIWPNANPDDCINKDMLTEIFSIEINADIVTNASNNNQNQTFDFCPHAGKVECGTLGFAYLKELLKNDAQQFKNESLAFSYYSDDSTTSKNLFIPSPAILRYSQSSLYNKIVAAMMSADDITEVSSSHAKFKVKSLKNILERSIVIALKKKDMNLAKQNQALLAALPDFTSDWNTKYLESDAKRNTMYATSEAGNPINCYLLFKTLRVKEIVNEINLSHNPTLPGLK